MKKKVFSFDAETNGLWGQAFSVAAVVREEDGSIKEWIGRCPIEGETNSWVKNNVLPEMEGIKVSHESYENLLRDFMKFYMENKEGADIIVHMGIPVESKLFIDAHDKGIIGDWDAPFPLIDISALPEIGTSVDSFNEKNGIVVPDLTGKTHNPLYDSYAALFAYEKVMNGYKSHRERN